MSGENKAASRERAYIEAVLRGDPDAMRLFRALNAVGGLGYQLPVSKQLVCLIANDWESIQALGHPNATKVVCKSCPKELGLSPVTRDLVTSRPGQTYIFCVDCIQDVFICPECGAVSFSKEDVRHGWCGACHRATGRPRVCP